MWRKSFFPVIFILVCLSCKQKNTSNLSKATANSNSTILDTSKTEFPPIEEFRKIEDSVKISSIEQDRVKNDAQPDPSLPKAQKVADFQKKKASIKKKSKKKTFKPAPKIQFDELEWDFGEITEGDIIEKKFAFTNTGKAPLSILSTEATCGCTRPSFPFLDIAPGESHHIGVRYNSVGKDGPQHPEVTVKTNAYPKVVKLQLKGFVKPKEGKKKVDTLQSNPFGN